jgi:hypothetical protein
MNPRAYYHATKYSSSIHMGLNLKGDKGFDSSESIFRIIGSWFDRPPKETKDFIIRSLDMRASDKRNLSSLFEMASLFKRRFLHMGSSLT